MCCCATYLPELRFRPRLLRPALSAGKTPGEKGAGGLNEAGKVTHTITASKGRLPSAHLFEQNEDGHPAQTQGSQELGRAGTPTLSWLPANLQTQPPPSSCGWIRSHGARCSSSASPMHISEARSLPPRSLSPCADVDIAEPSPGAQQNEERLALLRAPPPPCGCATALVYAGHAASSSTTSLQRGRSGG